jgi:UDP-N-acetylglucosamine--N-acetylmuramyl-(pentapeptide) pyrophosphoryl-undecaprenol N-acetylglucosamine transferase
VSATRSHSAGAPRRVIISGGGTGGHIFPAVAIAGALQAREPDLELLFVGAEGRMEMEKVPQAGYRIEGLPVAGFQRRLTARNLSFPFKLAASLWKARGILRRFDPHLAIGTGGYASGPVLRMAQRRGVPTLIQEQNSYPGVTNRLLARRADVICTAFADMAAWFPAERTVHTGNPVRQAIAQSALPREEGLAAFGLDPGRTTLFITGGSLGARVINEAIGAGLERLTAAGLQLIWQTGSAYRAAWSSRESASVRVLDFVARMDAAYAAADLIVSRAGGTIAELCVAGKPCILLPSPNVAEDHQTRNVEALVHTDAAVLVTDAEAPTRLVDEIMALAADVPRRERLSRAIRALARPDATERIADEAFRLLDQHAPRTAVP